MSTTILAGKLRHIRETLGHTPEVMARHLGITVSDVGRCESGEVPPLRIVSHWARFGLVSVESLIDDNQEVAVGSLATKPVRYLKNAWVKKRADGVYLFYFTIGSEEWALNLSGINEDELLSSEGPTLIQKKLDAWLKEQDSSN